MVIVDTSIWIRFLAGTEPYATELDRLLANDEVLGYEFVYGELLIGDRGGRAKLLAAYGTINLAATLSHIEVIEFVRRRKISARGIGWVDAHLLASALVAHSTIWTVDRSLAMVAEALGVAHQFPL